MNTNGTLYNKKFIDVILKFKQVIFNISIDDIDNRLEYERYPTDWNLIESNIIKFLKVRESNKNFVIYLCPTVSMFNVYYLPEYLNWAKSKKLPWYFNILHYPPNHSIKNLPNEIKDIVAERLTTSEFTSVKNFLLLPSESDIFIEEFIRLNEERDVIRRQDFHETFGEWAALLNRYRSK